MDPVGRSQKVIAFHHNRLRRRPQTSDAEKLGSKDGIPSSSVQNPSEGDSFSLAESHCLSSIIIFQGSSSGAYRILFVSDPVAASLGYSRLEITQDPQFWISHIHSDDLVNVLKELAELPQTGQFAQSYRILHKEGQYRWIKGSLQLISSKPKTVETPDHWLALFDFEMINTTLQRTQKLLKGIAEATKCLQDYPEIMITSLAKALSLLGESIEADQVCLMENSVDIETGEITLNLRATWMNPSTPSVNWIATWHQRSYHQLTLQDWLNQLSAGTTVIGVTSELPTSTIEKINLPNPYSFLLTPIHIDQQLWGFIGLVDVDPTRAWSESEQSALSTMSFSLSGLFKRQKVEAELRHNALHDSLTQLPNRRFFIDRLEQVLRYAERQEDYLFAVLFLDLDRFKVINDSLGHFMGDQLLKGIAERLKECLRPWDTVARLGGDEFTILLENIKSIDDVDQISNRIKTNLAKPFLIGSHEIFASASIGITLSHTGYKKPEDFLRAADTAMYSAKKEGGSRHEFYNAVMHTTAQNQLQLESDLNRALERQELVVFYQPIVSLFSKKIVGFEALVRWQHPVHGLLSPAEFIPIAEASGLIVSIDLAVMRIACLQIAEWKRQFANSRPLTISINLSCQHFSQPNLTESIKRILKDTYFNPENLRLEITETSVIQDIKLANTMISQLKDLCVDVYLDDFGTGYSTLSNIRHFPISALKIDRSFIRNLESSPESLEIVKTVIILAHNLGMDVIAEGVEAQQQMEQLVGLRCDYGQGFLFSKPLSCHDAEQLIAKQNH